MTDLAGADHYAYRAETCQNGHPRDRAYVRASTGERICRDCKAAMSRRKRERERDLPDYAERRAKVNAAQRRRHAARKATQ